MKVYNADGLIAGRLATHVAKQLLSGEEVVIINAEKAVVTGSTKNIMAKYWKKRRLTHTRRGPFFPRMPHRIMKRTVRGMLPYQTPHGREAYKRLKVHVGRPTELKDAKALTVKKASAEGKTRFMLLGDISRELGAKF
jgi:large subunit ribosomal protein L13